MRVAFNGRLLYDPGLRGFNRYCTCLIRAIQDLQDVELLLFSEERFPVHRLHTSRLRVTVRNLPASRTLYWEQWVLPRALRKEGVDVFHAPAEGGVPFRRPCPCVLTYHGVPNHSLASLVRAGDLPGTLDDYFDSASTSAGLAARVRQIVRDRLLSHLYLNAADLVITVSEFSKLELVRFMGLSPDRIRVIYEAADEVFTQPVPEQTRNEIRIKHGIPDRFILFVGGFDKRKNLSTLLSAFAELQTNVPGVALVLVGTGGDIRGCKVRLQQLGLVEGRDVIILRQLHDVELASLYRSAQFFTTLSWHEGFCLPIVEAMASGAPVLASSFGAIPEILGGGGWLVDPRDHGAVVHAMETILGSPELQKELRAKALSRAGRFSWRITAEQTLATYQELLSK